MPSKDCMQHDTMGKIAACTIKAAFKGNDGVSVNGTVIVEDLTPASCHAGGTKTRILHFIFPAKDPSKPVDSLKTSRCLAEQPEGFLKIVAAATTTTLKLSLPAAAHPGIWTGISAQMVADLDLCQKIIYGRIGDDDTAVPCTVLIMATGRFHGKDCLLGIRAGTICHPTAPIEDYYIPNAAGLQG